MRNARLALFAISHLTIVAVARAEMMSKLLMEENLQQRIVQRIQKYDALAQVQVSVNFRHVSSPLPGTSLTLKNFSPASGELAHLGPEEIESVRVSILSAKFPLPEWLKTQVQNEVTLPGSMKVVDFREMPEAMKKDIEQGLRDDRGSLPNLFETYFAKLETFSKGLLVDFGLKAGIAVFFLLGLRLLLGAAVDAYMSRRRGRELSGFLETKVVPVLQNIGNVGGKISASLKLDGASAGMLAGNSAAAAAPVATGGGGSGSAQSDVEGLPATALRAVIADCYWCGRDAYVAWLWSVMSPAQRLSLFTEGSVDADYLKFTQGLRPERGTDHLDPSYLDPLALQNVSQEDLANWVRKQPGAWHALSPIRQSTLPLSLQERLACLAEPSLPREKLAALPDRKSAKRRLEQSQRIGLVTLEDENTILHNPNLLPERMRRGVRSLVWLALKPFEERQRVLADWSAEDLASAWSSTPEILARLDEALPEKKKQMLQSFLASVTPSRASDVFSALVEEGLSTASRATLKSAA